MLACPVVVLRGSPHKGGARTGWTLDPKNARAVLRALEDSPRPEPRALRLLLLTRARKSEILRSRWENVYPAARVLVVSPVKSGAPRYITLCDGALAVMEEILRNGSPWIFPACGGEKPLADVCRFCNGLRNFSGSGMCGCTTCDIHSTACWSMTGTRSTKYNNCSATQTLAPLCAMCTWPGAHW